MTQIAATKRGDKQPLILLHGFPMSQAVWNDFAAELSTEYAVYTPDLPGFGNSEILPAPFTLEDVADALLEWIAENRIGQSVVIGHSLGGYVALALLAKKPDLFSGLGLFHSTAYADSTVKKESRNKVLEFIEKNGVQAFTSNFIPPLFADASHPKIQDVKTISMQASAEAVKGYTVAMRDRPDRTKVLENFNKPVLFIAGVHDSGIPADTIVQQASLSKQASVHVLDHVAHMGMFEKLAQSLTIVKAFLQGINDKDYTVFK